MENKKQFASFADLFIFYFADLFIFFFFADLFIFFADLFIFFADLFIFICRLVQIVQITLKSSFQAM